jgi:hypothetical protein
MYRSQRKSASPKRKSASPKRKSASPKRKSASPKRKSGVVSPLRSPQSPVVRYPQRRIPFNYSPYSPSSKRSTPLKQVKTPPKKKSASPTECPVCYEPTTCKINTCGHPLCGQCGRGMIASGRTIRCPLCRANFNEIRC